VLESALHYDIGIANDISGLLNPDMQKIILDANIPAIIMASDKSPGDADSFSDTLNAIDIILKRANDGGIKDLILDPGIGKWTPNRTANNDWELCRRFDELMQYDRPLLAAVSRKTFIGEALGRTPDERLAGTLAVTTDLIRKGASVIRTHDVKDTKDVIAATMKLQGKI
jgi:dihydropteroate synthase